ncbi:MAG: helix-turn-helix domain-containing protein [Anaerolineae bacterium]
MPSSKKRKGKEGQGYMTKEEAAAFLQVTPRTIERLVVSGKLTKHKRAVGLRRVYFDREEVERLASQIEPEEPTATDEDTKSHA